MALGLTGPAHLPAVQDHPQAEGPSFGCRDHRVQGQLDLDGILFIGDPQTPNETADMGVDGQTGKAEGHRPDDVRCLSAHPGQLHQILPAGRDLATVIGKQGLGHTHEIVGFALVEARRMDEFLQVGKVGSGKRLGVGVAGEQGRGGHVDPGVRALSRQDGGHEQLEGIAVVEFADGLVLQGQPLVGDPGSSLG